MKYAITGVALLLGSCLGFARAQSPTFEERIQEIEGLSAQLREGGGSAEERARLQKTQNLSFVRIARQFPQRTKEQELAFERAGVLTFEDWSSFPPAERDWGNGFWVAARHAYELARAGRLEEAWKIMETIAETTSEKRVHKDLEASFLIRFLPMLTNASRWAECEPLLERFAAAHGFGTSIEHDRQSQWATEFYWIRGRLELYGRGVLEKAHRDFRRAAEIAQWRYDNSEPNRKLYARSDLLTAESHLIRFYLYANDPEGALLEARKMAERLEDASEHEQEVERLLASARLQLGILEASDFDAAIEHHTKAIETSSDVTSLGDSFLNLAWIHARRGQFEKARECLEEIDRYTDLRSPYWGAAGERVALQLSVDRALARRDGESIASFDEYAGPLRDAMDLELEQWSRLERPSGGLGFLQARGRRNILSALIHLEEGLAPTEEGRWLGLRHVLRAQAQATIAVREGLSVPTLERIRDTIVPADGGILIYLPAQIGSHVFALTRTSLERFDLPADPALRTACEEFHELLLQPSFPVRNLEKKGRELCEYVLPEALRGHIESWHHVVIVGDDLLHDLMFEALPGKTERWLGLEKALSYLPSLPIGVWLADRSRERQDTEAARPIDLFLVVASAPAMELLDHYGLAPLPDGPSIRDGLQLPYASPRLHFAHGDRAWEEHFPESLPQTRMMHVIAHGVHDRGPEGGERDRPAGLLLGTGSAGEDGILWCDQVETRNLPPIVLLTACGTARGPKRLGEDGVNHLGGAFLLAGAESVMLTSEDLEATSSFALVGALHAELAQGEVGLAEGLRRARRKLVEQNPHWEHPYYHALPRVLGLGSTPVFDEPRATDPSPSLARFLPWLLFTLAAAFAFAFAKRRKA